MLWMMSMFGLLSLAADGGGVECGVRGWMRNLVAVASLCVRFFVLLLMVHDSIKKHP